MQHNASSGYFYGGIYVSRLAKEVGVTPLPYDPILPTQYLDFDAMKHHDFLKGKITGYTYNLRFNKETIMRIALPVPAFFDFDNKRRHYVLGREADAYKADIDTYPTYL